MSRATLLAQPSDIPEFLSTHVDQMAHFRGAESRDTKEVAFQYQEQWGRSECYFDLGLKTKYTVNCKYSLMIFKYNII